MSKVIYKRTTMERELGFVAAQNFLLAQANQAYANGFRVVRVWSGSGKSKTLDEVVLSKA